MLTCVLGVLETERLAGVVEPFLQLAGRVVAHRFTPVDRIDAQRSRVADVAAVLAKEPELAPGALLELANNAVTAEHFAQVDEAAADDLGLAWRVATTRAARGEYDEDAVARLLERDPDPDAPFNALTVRTARPLPEAKEEAWNAFYVDQSVPSGLSTYWMVMTFWQPQQREVLLPFTWRYLEEVPKLAGGLMLKVGQLDSRHVPRRGRPGVPRRGADDGACGRYGPDGAFRPARRQRHPGPAAARPRRARLSCWPHRFASQTQGGRKGHRVTSLLSPEPRGPTPGDTDDQKRRPPRPPPSDPAHSRRSAPTSRPRSRPLLHRVRARLAASFVRHRPRHQPQHDEPPGFPPLARTGNRAVRLLRPRLPLGADGLGQAAGGAKNSSAMPSGSRNDSPDP